MVSEELRHKVYKLIPISILMCSIAQGPGVVPLLEVVQYVVPAFAPAGEITLPAARLQVAFDSARGKKEQSELTVIYDPGTGYYLWNHMSFDPSVPEHTGYRIKTLDQQNLEAVTISDAAGLIQFDFGGALFGRVSRSRANNLSAPVTASINEFQLEIGTSGDVRLQRYYKLIPVFGPFVGFDAKLPPGYKPIGHDFFGRASSAALRFDSGMITSVSKQANNYRLVLQSRFDIEVIVDQNLDLVSAQQLTQPAK